MGVYWAALGVARWACVGGALGVCWAALGVCWAALGVCWAALGVY